MPAIYEANVRIRFTVPDGFVPTSHNSGDGIGTGYVADVLLGRDIDNPEGDDYIQIVEINDAAEPYERKSRREKGG